MNLASNAWQELIRWAGVMQLGVVAGSLAVPYLLHWRQDLISVRALTRQVFWTYAAYIWFTNLFFAVLSIFLPSELIDGTALASAVCLFIALYWGARLGTQFFYFDKKGLPRGGIYRYGEWLLVLCFAFFAVVYGLAAILNMRGAI